MRQRQFQGQRTTGEGACGDLREWIGNIIAEVGDNLKGAGILLKMLKELLAVAEVGISFFRDRACQVWALLYCNCIYVVASRVRLGENAHDSSQRAGAAD